MTRLATTLTMPPAVGLYALLVLGGCVSEEDPAARVTNSYKFALIGDMPYYADPGTPLPPEFVAAQYAAVLREIDDPQGLSQTVGPGRTRVLLDHPLRNGPRRSPELNRHPDPVLHQTEADVDQAVQP